MHDLSLLHESARREGAVNRRLFLAYAASLSSLPLLGHRAIAADRRVNFSTNPFSLGIASGDPTSKGIVLWTRLAPNPLEPAGGMKPEAVKVHWEIASDDSMRRVVRRGVATATPELAHSVHVEVDDLKPNRWYWYRFRAGDVDSPVGCTRTMPVENSTPDAMRFAYASCQHFESGHYTAYKHMAEEPLDLVFHLGDYIYESAGKSGRVRKHVGKEITSLNNYRVRHSQYKTDPLLQRMHAKCPWVVTWDDHELDNDCAGEFCQDTDVSPAEFLIRRANAYQAYYEMMPLRSSSLPSGPNMRIYRPISFGRLAEFFVLDTRQYRTDQPYDGKQHAIDDVVMSKQATILGKDQRHWLQSSLVKSESKWNVLAQQVMMAMVDRKVGEKQEYSMEKWTGYAHERIGLMDFIARRQVQNPIVLTGDIHSNWACDLRVDDRKFDTPVVATEFVGTSISSSGDGYDQPKDIDQRKAENACLRFFNGQRGYVTCTVTPQLWKTDYRVVSSVTKPDAPIRTRASFVVESGRPGAIEA